MCQHVRARSLRAALDDSSSVAKFAAMAGMSRSNVYWVLAGRSWMTAKHEGAALRLRRDATPRREEIWEVLDAAEFVARGPLTEDEAGLSLDRWHPSWEPAGANRPRPELPYQAELRRRLEEWLPWFFGPTLLAMRSRTALLGASEALEAEVPVEVDVRVGRSPLESGVCGHIGADVVWLDVAISEYWFAEVLASNHPVIDGRPVLHIFSTGPGKRSQMRLPTDVLVVEPGEDLGEPVLVARRAQVLWDEAEVGHVA